MGSIPTIEVEHHLGGTMHINEDDYNSKVHTKVKAKVKAKVAKPDPEKETK